MPGEDNGSVCLDIKYTSATLNELCLKPQCFIDFGRQTGGPGEVISLSAIGNGNVHGF